MPLGLARPLAVLRRHPWASAAGLVLLAVLGLGTFYGIREYRVRHHRAAAEAALSRCDFDRAREHLAVCLDLRPNDAGLHLLAAQVDRRDGRLDSASEHLDRCKDIRGRTEADERLERTMLTAQGGGLTEVEDYLLSRLRANDPACNRILEALAFGNIRVYRLERGAACLEELLAKEPENVTALHMLGIVSELMHQTDEAVGYYRRALAIQPGNYRIRLQLARALWQKGRVEEAGRLYEELLSEHREKGILLGLARYRIGQGRGEEGRRLLEELLAEHPRETEALLVLGKLDREAGREAEAEGWFRKVLDVQPHNREATYHLHQCLVAQAKTKEAETIQRRLNEIDADARRLDALRKQAIENPGDPKPRCEAGAIALKRGDEEEGLRWLLGVLNLNPDHGPTHAALADYYARRGEMDRAAFHRSRASRAP